jgi:hypothetical protein
MLMLLRVEIVCWEQTIPVFQKSPPPHTPRAAVTAKRFSSSTISGLFARRRGRGFSRFAGIEAVHEEQIGPEVWHNGLSEAGGCKGALSRE